MKLRNILFLASMFFVANIQARSYYQCLTICYVAALDNSYEDRYILAKDSKIISCFCGDMPVIFSLYDGDVHPFCKEHAIQAFTNLK